jgi:transcriptional regulator with XRE-family HTH domain
MRESVKGKWHGPWCAYFAALLEERKLTPSEFALLVNDRQNNVWQYLNGVIRPPLQKLALFARKLKLNDSERVKFIRLGRLAHSPEEVQRELAELRAENLSLRSELDTIRNHLSKLGVDLSGIGNGSASRLT